MNHKIEFDKMEWINTGEGSRHKIFIDGKTRVRLVEFSEGFNEKDWCKNGHAGAVLDGGFTLDFNGRPERYEKGEIFFIPAGESGKHKAVVGKNEKVTLLLFENMEE